MKPCNHSTYSNILFMSKIYYVFILFFCVTWTVLQAQTPPDKRLFQSGKLTNNVVVKNANSINTAELEFSPVFYQTGLVYVSSRFTEGPKDKKIGETFFELFFSDTDRNGIPLKPEVFSLEINSQKHEGPVTFNEDFNEIYFTRNSDVPSTKRGANGKFKNMQQIYQAKKGLYDWKDVKKLAFNNDNYHCMHPSLSADGQQLYFTSDMPGGFGGTDIYVSIKKGDRWSRPQNLGAAVNSERNDAFPFIHESGTLFFSSSRQPGFGGFDIYKIDLLDTKAKVENLSTPFNSSADDLGFILNQDGTRGYFASNREGGFGKDDIYMFEAPEGLQGLETPNQIPYRIIAYDDVTQERIPQASVRIFERAADGFIEGDNLYDVQLLPSEDGEMVMKLVRKKEADLGKPLFVTDASGEVSSVIAEGKNYIVLVSKEGYKSGEVVFSSMNASGYQTIEVPLSPISCLTLSGKTLNNSYNASIPGTFVEVTNLCDNTTQSVRTNVQGEFEFCIPRGCQFTITGQKEGYKMAKTEVSTVSIRGNRSLQVDLSLEIENASTISNNDNIMNEPIKAGTVIVLENIYYDFNKSSIRTGAARELDAVLNMMAQYPSLEIELIAHTDSRGKSRYNLDLSLRRAESAKSYLTSRGIAARRIKTFGYGESNPRNHCADGVECTEEEHQYNRRTEVKIVKIDEGVDVKYKDDGPEIIDAKN